MNSWRNCSSPVRRGVISSGFSLSLFRISWSLKNDLDNRIVKQLGWIEKRRKAWQWKCSCSIVYVGNFRTLNLHLYNKMQASTTECFCKREVQLLTRLGEQAISIYIHCSNVNSTCKYFNVSIFKIKFIEVFTASECTYGEYLHAYSLVCSHFVQ